MCRFEEPMKLGIVAGQYSWTIELSDEASGLVHAFVEAQTKMATALESLAETAIALAAEEFKSGGKG